MQTSSIMSDYPMIMSFFTFYKISKLDIKYKLYNPNDCFNHECPICLEKFKKFDNDINSLIFYGCDKLVNKLFGTSIKYAPNFIRSDTFTGKKNDFVFKLGDNGLGYYYDSPNKFMIDNHEIELDIIGDLPCKHAFHHNCIKKWAKKKLHVQCVNKLCHLTAKKK